MQDEETGGIPPETSEHEEPEPAAEEATSTRGRLSADAITAAAIRVADIDGLEAVSIRRVAAELDARPMSLYTHFSSKDDLLSSMAENGIERILVQQKLPDDWRVAVALIARRMYAVFISHPWHVKLYTQKLYFGPNATRLAKQMARAVAELPLEPPEVWLIMGTVNDYVLGHSLRAVTTPGGAELRQAISKTDVVEFPELSSLENSFEARVTTERFEAGLQMVLDGVEQSFAPREPDAR